jgi:long-chain acyl-CoA synthetase
MEAGLSVQDADELKAPVTTLCAMLDHAVSTGPERVALRHLDAALTYRELGRAVAALARRLAAMVAPGEVVALVLPNSIEFQIAYFAALKARAAPALLNPLYPAAQLSPLLQEATARAVLCTPATRDMVAGLTADLGIPGVVCLGQDITVPELVAETEPSVGRAGRPRSPVVQRRHHWTSQGYRAHARPPCHGSALHRVHVADAERS